MQINQAITCPISGPVASAVGAGTAGTLGTGRAITTATGGIAHGIILNAEAANGVAALGVAGLVNQVLVNANSTNIAIGDGLKPSAGGAFAKCLPGEQASAVALETAAADGIYIAAWVLGPRPVANTTAFISSASAITVDATNIRSVTTVIASNNGTQAVSLIAGSLVAAGTVLIVKKTGTAGAVTITPTAGTIAGGSTYATLDAQNDVAQFVSDGTNWILTTSNIA